MFRGIGNSRAASGQTDMIQDFSARQKDKVDLSAIDANALRKGNQAFSFIGQKAFGYNAGELRSEKVKGGVCVSGDVNGDGQADFALLLKNLASLKKGDFFP